MNMEPLSDFDWPVPLRQEAFHGLAGEIVHSIEPHTEADPAAILVQLLVCIGNAVGRGPCWRVEATQHRLNLFVCIVGATSSGRKGTSLGQARRLVEFADPEWKERQESGLSSGEGLVWAVRDEVEERRKARTKEEKANADEHGFITELADVGIDDKRLLVIESELASVLERMKREGNSLSAVLRQAWDAEERVSTMTKHDKARATDAHVSIIGHITVDELRRKLTETEQSNGFANRFLWICAKRSKLLPFGGEAHKIDWAPLARRLTTAIEVGKTTGLLDFDGGAREVWQNVYPVLTASRRGMFGAVTARAAAQVRRLATVYCLLEPDPDRVPTVSADHLSAALAVWDYAEVSAKFLFGEKIGDPVADAIVAELRKVAPAGATRTDLSRLFGRHRSADEIDRALAGLEAGETVYRATEPTGGRPATRFYHFCEPSEVSETRSEGNA